MQPANTAQASTPSTPALSQQPAASNQPSSATPGPLPTFHLERFFARHEFTAPHLLCCSDCQPLSMAELLQMADPETKALWHNLSLGYTETAGLPALRAEICRQYSTIGPNDVTVLAPEEGVYLTMRALLSPGDTVICMFPGYQSLYAIAQSMGCHVKLWEPDCSAGGLSFRVASLIQLLEGSAASGKQAKLVVVNFPHNPTGQLLSQDDWRPLVEACAQHGCYLFSDEMYRALELDAASRLPSACDLYPKAITLSGVSKTLGLPGLRIGWLASRACMDRPVGQPLQLRVRELKDYTTICCSAPSEVLALVGLRAAPAITTRHLATIRSNLRLTEAFFEEFQHLFEWSSPAAGSVAFPRLISGEHVEAFCERVVAGSGVLLLPATVYDHAPSVERGHFRVGLGRTNLPQCLDHLRAYLQAHPKPPE